MLQGAIELGPRNRAEASRLTVVMVGIAGEQRVLVRHVEPAIVEPKCVPTSAAWYMATIRDFFVHRT
jgi:hypothetical protein